MNIELFGRLCDGPCFLGGRQDESYCKYRSGWTKSADNPLWHYYTEASIWDSCFWGKFSDWMSWQSIISFLLVSSFHQFNSSRNNQILVYASQRLSPALFLFQENIALHFVYHFCKCLKCRTTCLAVNPGPLFLFYWRFLSASIFLCLIQSKMLSCFVKLFDLVYPFFFPTCSSHQRNMCTLA